MRRKRPSFRPAQKPGFPFRYEFRAVFSLEANQLEVNYVVKDLDDRTFYFSVGAHEARFLPGQDRGLLSGL